MLVFGTPVAGGFCCSASTTGVSNSNSSSSDVISLFAQESELPPEQYESTGYGKTGEPEMGKTGACHSQPKTEASRAEASVLYDR